MGQLTFHSCPLYVSIDFGTTHNFIAWGMVKILRLEPTIVDYISIEMLDGVRIISNQMLLSETIVLRGWELVIDLIEFNMLDFDVIHNMDILSKYEVETDYRNKKVEFSLGNGDEFTFG